MAGSSSYSDEQIWFVVSLLRSKVAHKEIIGKFNNRWPPTDGGHKFGPKQLKYLKNSYGDDPSFV
jgi:hypothetical protein